MGNLALAGLLGGGAQGLGVMAERQYQSERDEAEFLRKKALMKYGAEIEEEMLTRKTGSGYYDPDTLKELTQAQIKAREAGTEGLLSGVEFQAEQRTAQTKAEVERAGLLSEAEEEAEAKKEREGMRKAWPNIAKRYGLDTKDEATREAWIDSAIADVYVRKLGDGVSTETKARIISDASKAWDEMLDHDVHLAAIKEFYPEASTEELETLAKTKYLADALQTQVGLISPTAPGTEAARELTKSQQEENLKQRKAFVDSLVQSKDFEAASTEALGKANEIEKPAITALIEEARTIRETPGTTYPSEFKTAKEAGLLDTGEDFRLESQLKGLEGTRTEDTTTAIDMEKIYQIESSMNPEAVNKRSGARGLGQITSIALKDWNNLNPNEKYTKKDLFNPVINRKISRWTMNERIPQMLRSMKIQDTPTNRLIAYNWGIGNLKKFVDGKIKKLPKETENYLLKYQSLLGR